MNKVDKSRIAELSVLISKAGLTKHQMSLVNELFAILSKQHAKVVKSLEEVVIQSEIMTKNSLKH